MPATGALAVVVAIAIAIMQWSGPAAAPAPGASPAAAAVERQAALVIAEAGAADPSGGASLPRASSPLATSAFGFVSGPHVARQLLGTNREPVGIVSVGAAGSKTTAYSPGLRTGGSGNVRTQDASRADRP